MTADAPHSQMPALDLPADEHFGGGMVGDFVLAQGPGARDWLRELDGFALHEDLEAGVLLAARGQVRLGGERDARWAGLFDLIEGTPEAPPNDIAEGLGRTAWRGRFAQVVWRADGALEAMVDHFDSIPLYWYRHGGLTAIATDLRVLLRAPGCRREIDEQAIYHYLNFACIPAPFTVCRQIRRLQPGSRLRLHGDSEASRRYYLPEYPEDLQGSDHDCAALLRERIFASVRDHRPDEGSSWGCFLSGGTDSSSILSILASQHPDRAIDSFSIGFSEAGYDELGYARLAAEACGARGHFATVGRDDALGLLDDALAAYDQPFGNASAIPTLACARLARLVGTTRLIAGDGGDEIFGGNERYAKDRVMQAFHRLPGPLKSLSRSLASRLAGGHSHLLNRANNFVRRASLPNPDRFYTDDSFASDYHEELLTEEFRSRIARDSSLEYMRAVYGLGGPADELHRLMRLDLSMAIAQNDLVKVQGAGKHHGISVRFPYLDPALVDFTGRLPARHKLRGLRKRFLFKRAMAGVLPEAILRKPKQGFGLPIAVWLRDDPAMRARLRETLLDQRVRERGWIRPEFVSRLLDLHTAGGWDHSAPLWQLLILELWLRRYVDGR